MSKRLNKEKQLIDEPKRIAYAKDEITKLGYEIILEDASCIGFLFNGSMVKIFPYSGWFSGKSVNDGRGIKNLLKQIKQ